MGGPLARWIALHLRVPGIVPVIVYQMGKVGSVAVFAALERAGVPAFHVHRMNRDHVDRMRLRRRALGWAEIPVAPHDVLGLSLNERVIAKGRRAAIVTIVRDPIARNLSSYFEYLAAICPGAGIDDMVDGFHTVPVDEPPHLSMTRSDRCWHRRFASAFHRRRLSDHPHGSIRPPDLKCESSDEAGPGLTSSAGRRPRVPSTSPRENNGRCSSGCERVRMTPDTSSGC